MVEETANQRFQVDGAPVAVETERGVYDGLSWGDDFHLLLDVEDHPAFEPRLARWQRDREWLEVLDAHRQASSCVRSPIGHSGAAGWRAMRSSPAAHELGRLHCPRSGREGRMTWDVFISHASEDKDAVALPLAKLLGDRGVKVWIDAHELKLGDSLRGKIDEGLAKSQWGLVILSPSFFRKPWFQAEVDALVSREMGGQRVVLPVWHDVTAADVARCSPLLAARLGVSTASGLDKVCDAVLSAMGRGRSAEDTQPTASTALEDVWFAAFEDAELDPASEVLDASNRRLGPYLLQDRIGRGGSGIVFRARHAHLGNTVALKVLYPLDDRNSAFTQAAERGLRGLASVRHPNVLSPLDFGYLRAQGRVSLFIATDLIDGTNVEIWSSDLRGSDALRRRLAVAVQLSQAVKAAHDCRFIGAFGFEERGVLHGDIKPANVLVETDSERVLLLDFMIPDIQRLLPRRSSSSGLQRDSDGHYDAITSLFGTPGFMAPEQEVDGTVSEASDIYSLGLTLSTIFWPLHSRRHAIGDGQSNDRESALARLIGAMTASRARDRPRGMQDVLDTLAAA